VKTYWYTVFCKVPFQRPYSLATTFDQLDSDWETLAPTFDLSKEKLDALLAKLKLKTRWFEIGGVRIPFRIWQNQYLAENIATVTDADPKRAIENAAQARASAGFMLAEDQLGTVFECLARELAFEIARSQKGLVRDPHKKWFDPGQPSEALV